jgi:hypothetical protein
MGVFYRTPGVLVAEPWLALAPGALLLAAIWLVMGVAGLVVAAWPASAAPAGAQLAPGAEYPVDALGRACVPLAEVTIGPDAAAHGAAACRVTRFGAFATLGDTVYYRAIYCLTPHHAAAEPDGGCRFHGSRALVLFAGDKGAPTARLLLERADPEIGVTVYDEPAIVATPVGTILHVPIRLDGTGNYNESEYYLWRAGAWHRLDALGWVERFRPPPGRYVRKGVWPSLRDMTARIALYKDDDPNCCPTGGTAVVALALRDDALVATSVRLEPARE